MLHSLPSGLAASVAGIVTPALAERLTLLLNHVIGAEPAAAARLAPHHGAVLALTLERWPALLPPPPPLAWRVTPAGLLQWCGPDPVPAGPGARLSVAVDAANPALLLADAMAGRQPAVRIDGDAQLAGDVNWLIENLRWDVAADLERLFGPTVAVPLHQAGRTLARALSGPLAALARLGARAAGVAGGSDGRAGPA